MIKLLTSGKRLPVSTIRIIVSCSPPLLKFGKLRFIISLIANRGPVFAYVFRSLLFAIRGLRFANRFFADCDELLWSYSLMQVRPIKRCIITCLVFFFLLFFFGTDPFLSFTYNGSAGNADAAPVSSSKRRARTAVREGIGAQREIELVRTTPQGVTIQLFIPASDFEIRTQDNNGDHFQGSRVETQTVSFPGCRFTVQSPGALRLPVQSTLISVPVDADFQVRVVEQEFSTRKVAVSKEVSGLSESLFTHTPKTDRFFPANLVETREAGWIRENRVLPIQFNPVQYNPVRRELRLYHKLIVEVRFLRS
ncbi:hypothetical protein C6496_21775, partial [Candidatus Poribacteria bacterium]